MTDPLTNPDGVAYPPTVQQAAKDLLSDYDGTSSQDRQRETFVYALEAAIAADREHRPPKPELDEEHTRRLMRVWLSGFYSGGKSCLATSGVPREVADVAASHMAYHLEQDPLAYATVEADAVALFTSGARPDNRTIYAYGPDIPHDQKDD